MPEWEQAVSKARELGTAALLDVIDELMAEAEARGYRYKLLKDDTGEYGEWERLSPPRRWSA